MIWGGGGAVMLGREVNVKSFLLYARFRGSWCMAKQSVFYCSGLLSGYVWPSWFKRRVELNRWSEQNTDLPANKRIILTSAQV
jgi:hypothetical protein